MACAHGVVTAELPKRCVTIPASPRCTLWERDGHGGVKGYGDIDVIPFFRPVIVRKAMVSLLVAAPVLASDTLNCYAGGAHYSGVATVQ